MITEADQEHPITEVAKRLIHSDSNETLLARLTNVESSIDESDPSNLRGKINSLKSLVETDSPPPFIDSTDSASFPPRAPPSSPIEFD